MPSGSRHRRVDADALSLPSESGGSADREAIRIDRTRSATPGGFVGDETAYLHFTLDHNGVPFLDDLGGGWVTGEGPGWVLHHRTDTSDLEGDTAFFSGLPLTEEQAAIEAAMNFLSALQD
jgi:hypothetical protein